MLCGLDFEVGDKVQVRPEGSALWFVGHVIKLNDGGETMDVEMVGDDSEDIEYAVPRDNVRKLLSHRLIKRRLRRLARTLHEAIAAGGRRSDDSTDRETTTIVEERQENADGNEAAIMHK